jgi:hypothetical protein
VSEVEPFSRSRLEGGLRAVLKINDPRTDAATETKAAPPICGVAGFCSAVNQLSKSVMREMQRGLVTLP